MPTPAQHAELALLASRLDAATHGEKGALVEAAAVAMQVTPATVYSWLPLHRHAPRKRRSDAGKTALTLGEMMEISTIITETIRQNGKVGMTLERAINRARADGRIKAERVDESMGEIRPLTVSAIARALRCHHLDPTSLKTPAPHVRLRSLYPNYCWQEDASVCILYYLPSGKGQGHAVLVPLNKATHYKNKPENLKAIEKFRVIRYVITDHYSGVIWVRYYPHSESGEHSVAMLANAMAKKTTLAAPFHGRPEYLMVDPGATAANMVRLFCDQLGIKLIVNKAGNPRAKGQVEQANNLWERYFESGLAFVQHEINSFDDLNRLSEKVLLHFNATRIHSRHGKTRFDKWLEITHEQLVETVSEAKLLELAHGSIKNATVTGEIKVRFEGRTWCVRHVPDVVIGAKVMVSRSPFIEGGAVALVKGADGKLTQYPLMADIEDAGCFPTTAAVIGVEYKGAPDTLVETRKKDILKLGAGAATLAEAEAARRKKTFVPLVGFNPYHAEETATPMTFLPRTGATTATPEMETAERMIPVLRAAKQLRDAAGDAWQPERLAFLEKRFPDGVPESTLARMIAESDSTLSSVLSPLSSEPGVRHVKQA